MTGNHLKEKYIGKILLIVVGVSSLLYLRGEFQSITGINLSNQDRSNLSYPSRLIIPSINVDTLIESVGVTTKGAMGVPKNISNVAWFSLGIHPGEEGSAVIAGHYGWKNGKVVAFDNLGSLKKGDRVYVEDSKKEIHSFIVRESRIYDRRAITTEVFSSESGAHLNLIACIGTWDTRNKTYDKRLVVFTDVVPADINY